MPEQHDDFAAIRTMVEALKPFDQKRIIRWASEIV